MTTRHYPAKVLLFGEYTLFQGSGALVIPYPVLGAYWINKDVPPPYDLAGLAKHLAQAFTADELNTAAFGSDVRQGWWLESTIPAGYGLGSSGAVCAAILDRYGTAETKQASLSALQSFFARMESYFHGSSSGIDPLVSYVDRPLWLDSTGGFSIVALPTLPDHTFFLLDTGQPRETLPLVHFFKEQWQHTSFRQIAITDWVQPTQRAIATCLQGDAADVWAAFTDISTYQLAHLPPMIPAALRPVWQKSLAEDRFRLKLCGAGGGGFMLGLAKRSLEITDLVPGFTTSKLY